jgi:hypothetical protein
LFSRAELAGMRDRTRRRNYSAEGEEFRREHERRRVWGLRQRYARKEIRLYGSTANAAAAYQRRVDELTSPPAADQAAGSAPVEPVQPEPVVPAAGPAEPPESETMSDPTESEAVASKPDGPEAVASKPAEPQATASKLGRSKPGRSKPGRSKPGRSKPGRSKPGRSELALLDGRGDAASVSVPAGPGRRLSSNPDRWPHPGRTGIGHSQVPGTPRGPAARGTHRPVSAGGPKPVGRTRPGPDTQRPGNWARRQPGAARAIDIRRRRKTPLSEYPGWVASVRSRGGKEKIPP